MQKLTIVDQLYLVVEARERTRTPATGPASTRRPGRPGSALPMATA